MNHLEIISILKHKILDTLAPLITPDNIITDLPYHGNIGDTLICQGEIDFLDSINCPPKARSSLFTFTFPSLDHNTQILLHGGGNFGDLYRTAQDFRIQILEKYPDNQIIMFPQSVWYSNPSYIATDAQKFRAHKHLVLCARDQSSYNFLKAHNFGNNLLMIPDMAFSMRPNRFNHNRLLLQNKSLIIRRLDAEGCDNNLDLRQINGEIRDWPTFEHRFGLSFWLNYTSGIMRRMGNNPLKPHLSRIIDRYIEQSLHPRLIHKGIAFLNEYSHIYTNRLHGLILATLMEKQISYFDNTTKKLSAFVDTWLQNADFITPISNN